MLCAYVLFVPLAFWSMVYRPFSLPKSITAYLLVFAMAAATAYMGRTNPGRGGRRVFGLTLTAFCLSLLPGALLSIAPSSVFLGSYRQLFGVAAWVSLAGLAYATAAVEWTDEHISDLAAVVCGTAGVVSVIAWVQAFAPDINLLFNFEATRRPVFSTFGNAGYLAVFLAFALPVIYAKMTTSSKVSTTIWYAVIQTLAAGALVFTGSRIGWAAAAVALAAVIFAAGRLRGGLKPVSPSRESMAPSSRLRENVTPSGRATAWAAAFLPALVFTAALFSPLATVDEKTGPASSRLATGYGTLQSRTAYWTAAVKMEAERPLTGYGPDTFGLIYPRLATKATQQIEPDTMTDQAHNLFLQMGATLGVVPALIFGLLLIKSAGSIRTILSVGKGGGAVSAESKILITGLAAGALGHLLAVQGIIDSWGTAFIPWLFIGLVAGLNARHGRDGGKWGH